MHYTDDAWTGNKNPKVNRNKRSFETASIKERNTRARTKQIGYKANKPVV